MTRPQDMDLSMAVVNGNTEGLVAMVEAVRRYGARDLELGYDWPDDAPDPGPDDTVTWYAAATFRTPVGTWAQTRCEAVGTPGNHQRAQLQALAELIRSRGGNVALVDMDGTT